MFVLQKIKDCTSTSSQNRPETTCKVASSLTHIRDINKLYLYACMHGNQATCVQYSSCNEPAVIPFKKLKSTGKEIGRGPYGRIFEVEYRKTLYAAKELHALLLMESVREAASNIKDNFLRECHIWSRLQHPCIVQFIG